MTQIPTIYNYDPQNDSCTTQKSFAGRYWYKTYKLFSNEIKTILPLSNGHSGLYLGIGDATKTDERSPDCHHANEVALERRA